MKTLYRVSTFLILALGILHICLTPVIFRSLTTNTLWFISGGLMIVFVSFFNFILMSTAGKELLVRILCNVANVMGLALASAMFVLEWQRIRPGPSTWFVLALLIFETVAAFRYSS